MTAEDEWAYAPGADLPGGYVKAIVRIGHTVRRPLDANSKFVHELLRFLEHQAFDASPRFLGVDEESREILTYVEGHVAWNSVQPPSIWSDESLAGVARLTRRLHDLTAGATLAGNAPVVCHNDLSPKNTVYHDLGGGYRPVAFIDWDGAAPGEPEDDLARMLWQFLLTSERRLDAASSAKGMVVMLDAYGYQADRTPLLDRIDQNMRDTRNGIRERAASGEPAYRRLIDLGALEYISNEQEWLRCHCGEFEAVLGSRQSESSS